MLRLPNPDARALISGESIVALVARNSVDEGDELELVATGPRDPAEVKAAYVRWNDAALPPGSWVGVVEALVPATVLDAEAGLARHVLTVTPPGDIAILRVYGPDGPVLSEEAFAARRTSIEGDLSL